MGGFARLTFMAGSGLCGAALMYFFDPERGRRRRNMTRDQLVARVRRAGRAAISAGRGAAADAYGVSHRIGNLVPHETEQPDDETLRQRVESMLFRDRDIPKGNLNLTCENGTVILRGELDSPEDILRLERRVERVPGVRGVQNLVHPHGTPAPNKERSRQATVSL
jgi:hypothetical protein